jgi:hypothetical protein
MNERRSLFFPLALIAAGVLWLLINFGYIPAANLWALTRLWPILLIGAGVSLLLRDRVPGAGLAISALMVIAAFAAVIYAPQLGWAGGPAWHWDFTASGAIPGSGDIETETRDLADFTSLTVNYPAEVTIVQGSAPSVSITADDNLLPQMKTEVSGGSLVIESTEKNSRTRVNPTDTVEITLTVTELTHVQFNSAGSIKIDGYSGSQLELSLDGAGNLDLTDAELGTLTINLDGAGSITASGTADNLVVELDGVGSLNASDLTAQDGLVTVDGLGSATVRVEERLEVNIDGLGSVSYYGSPQLIEETDGLGSVKHLGD